jgi:hypothetical protein
MNTTSSVFRDFMEHISIISPFQGLKSRRDGIIIVNLIGKSTKPRRGDIINNERGGLVPSNSYDYQSIQA